MTEKYKIGGMTCAACQSRVLGKTRKVPGVSEVQVNLLTGTMELERDPGLASTEDVIRAVTNAGYSAELLTGQTGSGSGGEEPRTGKDDREVPEALVRLILSVVFFLPLFWLAMGGMLHLPRPDLVTGETGAMLNAVLQLFLFLPILFWNRGYFRRGVRALLHGGANMDTLVALGAGAGAVSSLILLAKMAHLTGCGALTQAHGLLMDLSFEGASMVLILVSFGKLLESRAKKRTCEAIEKLMDLTPPRATILRDGTEVEIDVRDLKSGDTAVLRTGCAVPADGTLTEGLLSLDQSALTGESFPVEREPGSALSAGTTVLNGYGKMKVERAGSDTTLAKVAALVEAAAASRAPAARIADKACAVFVPVVLLCALTSFLCWLIWGPSFHDALSSAMAVLLISCPCALGLATPVAVMAGTGRGAELGILFRNAETLETLHKVKTILLDKTGTVTKNRPAVTQVFPAEGVSRTELLSEAASLEAASQHPLAEAVLTLARQEGIRPRPVTDATLVPGEGIRARIDGTELSGGNLRMMRKKFGSSWDMPQRAEREDRGETVVFFAEGERYLGGMAFADPVTPEAVEAVRDLRKLGLTPVLLTGDSAGAALSAGQQLGIEDVRGGLLPADKERIVREFQAAGPTAMAGDGINDAPALARADAGIAVARGTDIALASADVVLMKSDLRSAAAAVSLSRAVIRTIRVNLFWAFFYNIIGIPVAAGLFYPWLGLRLPPEFGAAAMSLSSVCVVLNALRLRRFSSSANDNINQHKESSPMNERIMSVDGMACAHCAGRVEQALKQISGVRNASVDLTAKTVTIQADDAVADAVLTDAVRNAGYTPGAITRK